MKRVREFGLLIALVVGIQTAGVAILGLVLDIGEKTVVWLIFGVIVAIGLAGLRGQAAGLGQIIEILEDIRKDNSAQHPKLDE
jgi:hypothetical protein